MPQITLRVSDEILKTLQTNADTENLTLTDYILCKSIPDYISGILTVGKVVAKIPSKKTGDIFSIKDLFSTSDWKNSTPGSHISTGRLFYESYKKNEFNLKSNIKFIGKNSANLAIYKKLTDN